VLLSSVRCFNISALTSTKLLRPMYRMGRIGGHGNAHTPRNWIAPIILQALGTTRYACAEGTEISPSVIGSLLVLITSCLLWGRLQATSDSVGRIHKASGAPGRGMLIGALVKLKRDTGGANASLRTLGVPNCASTRSVTLVSVTQSDSLVRNWDFNKFVKTATARCLHSQRRQYF